MSRGTLHYYRTAIASRETSSSHLVAIVLFVNVLMSRMKDYAPPPPSDEDEEHTASEISDPERALEAATNQLRLLCVGAMERACLTVDRSLVREALDFL